MEVFFDFHTSSAGQGALQQAERLLACYQKALGHELPNQLVALQGLAQLLERELSGRVDDEGRDCLQRLAILARRVDEVVRTLAQIGRWRRDPSPAAPTDVAELAHEAVAEVNLLSPGWTVQYDGLHNLPPLVAPRNHLYQVLVQLLRNSARAAAPGRALCVTVGGRRGDNGTSLWVADNGAGIPREMMSRLGEPFSGDRPERGPGLGLFVVCLLTAGWAGTLRIQSERGQGTTVTFLVP